METKILFIYPDIGGNSIDFSPAIEVLSGFLKNKGFLVDLIHIHDQSDTKLDYDEIFSKVSKSNPDIIGITSTTYQYDISNKICYEIKNRGVNVPVFLGGIHATIAPYDLKDSYFDAFCIGEGELPLTDILTRIKNKEDIYTTRGFHFKKDGNIITNPNGDIVENLDDIPFRDYEIMNTKKLLQLKNNWLSIAFSRGCLYDCNFCINQKLKKIYNFDKKMKYFRVMSVERTMDELLHLLNTYSPLIKVINLDDDLIILDKEWFFKFADEYEERIYKPFSIKYAINGRANLLDEPTIKRLKESGCELVRVGFETGNNDMRNLILKKGISDKQLNDVFYYFNKYKLRSLAFTMIGIPGETEETIKDSINMLIRLKPTLIRMAIFEPFIGTPLYDYCRDKKLIKEIDTSNCFENSSLIFDDLDEFALKKYSLLFPWYLNISLLELEYKNQYIKLIDKFENKLKLLSDIAVIKEEVLDADKEISLILKRNNIEHFEYFSKNNFYYHFYSEMEEDE